MSSADKFRTIGHNAPTTVDTNLVEEQFPPIQRVTIWPGGETIGYLFRNIEYAPGCVDDIVLYTGTPSRCFRSPFIDQWSKWNGVQKRYRGWFFPSGTTFFELCYRANKERTKLTIKVQDNLRESFRKSPRFGTSITRKGETAIIAHNGNIASSVEIPSRNLITEQNDPTANAYLRALLGNRYAVTAQTFTQYGSRIVLIPPKEEGIYGLVIGVDPFNNSVGLVADACKKDRWYYREIILARNLLGEPDSEVAYLYDPQYEVRDE